MKKILKLILLIALSVTALASCGDDTRHGEPIVKDNGDGFVCDYTIVYGEGDASSFVASSLSNDIFYEHYGISPEIVNYSWHNRTQKEIIVGITDEKSSIDFVNEIDLRYPSSLYYSWGYSFDGDKLCLYASAKGYASEMLLDMLDGLMKDGGFSLEAGVKVIKFKSISEYLAEKLAEEQIKAEKEFARRLAIAKEKNDALLNPEVGTHLTLFGGGYTASMTGAAGRNYPTPDCHPTEGAHPRVNINGEMLDGIKAALGNAAFASTASEFWVLADTEFYGEFPKPEKGLTYNYDGRLLAIIESKALAYLVTGKEAYAYEAIVGVKNAMRTMKCTKDQFIDPFKAYGYLMTVAGEVYDWCYGVMTREDKEQFVAGVEHLVCRWDPSHGIYNMEIGFPPTRLNGINGHGTSVMLMRDYLTFAAAVYDEFPDWWSFCAGRFYDEFIEPFDEYFKSGMIHQGTACYAPNKLYTYLWSCWIIETLGGERPFKSNIDEVCISLLSHMMPNGRLFPTGDGVTGNGATLGISYQCCLMSAALNVWSPTMSIIFLANGVDPDESGELPLIRYNRDPLSQLTVRDSWQSDAAAVFMKIGELNAGNHEHQDSGTFQIYYKGLLAGNSGVYEEYGDTHWQYYHQATVSKCGILVFDPDKYSDAIYGADGKVKNPSEAFYTGGQRRVNFERVAKETGVSFGYAEDGVTPVYAYLAGDLTAAYDSDTVELVERRMLTVYTGDERYPMLFFVFDGITSTKAQSVKKFLLQTKNEPTLYDTDGDGICETVSVSDGEGKLVLTSLLDCDGIEKLGGSDNNFLINGVQLDPTGHENTDHSNEMWGRVEIFDSGSEESKLLNVMYVTDEDNEEMLAPRLIETELVAGAYVDGVAAIFVKSSERSGEVLEFELTGQEQISCYVSGVESGIYNVEVDGVKYGKIYATEDGGMLRFTVPAGKIRIVPSNP